VDVAGTSVSAGTGLVGEATGTVMSHATATMINIERDSKTFFKTVLFMTQSPFIINGSNFESKTPPSLGEFLLAYWLVVQEARIVSVRAEEVDQHFIE
jgi:hypothetical protein